VNRVQYYPSGCVEPNDSINIGRGNYLLPATDEQRSILYNPFRGVIREVERDVWDEVAGLDDDTRRAVLEDVLPGDTISWEHFEAHPLSLGHRSGEHAHAMYRPTHAVFLMGRACNSRCVYCYANANAQANRGASIPEEAARTAIRMVAENTREVGQKPYFAFHGPGEPMLHADLIERLLDACEDAVGAGAQYHLVTNGTVRKNDLVRLGKRIRDIQISFDGPSDIHNAQRPLANGGDSWALAIEAIHALRDAGVNVTAKATVTGRYIGRMDEVFHFARKELGGLSGFYLGLVLPMGRAEDDQRLDVRGVIDAYWSARQHYPDAGVFVVNAEKVYPDIIDRYCGITDPNFCITPEGWATACFAVTDLDDERSETYFFGRFDERLRAFEFDMERVRRLRGLKVSSIAHCRNCFAAAHCGGDCMARLHAPGGPRQVAEEATRNDPRCRLTRTFVYTRILEQLSALQT